MISLNPKDWLLAALAGLVAILGAVALFLRGSVFRAEARADKRDAVAATAKADQIQKANESIVKTTKEGRENVKKVNDKDDLNYFDNDGS